jgi:ABC-type glycerol-3-phosphate transport system substrate-binding protein
MKRIFQAVLGLAVAGGVFASGASAPGNQSSKVVFWTSHGPPDNGVLQNIVQAYNATTP